MSPGTVRAASIWTTPEGPKATFNYLYYGWKYLGVWETAKWAKNFLREFHDVVGKVFEDLIEKCGQQGTGGGSGGGGDGGGVGDGAGLPDDWLAFPDFIGADSQIRGEDSPRMNFM